MEGEMKIGYLQYSPVFGDKKKNLDTIARMISEAQADLLVLPELCTTGYCFASRQQAAEQAEEFPGDETSGFFTRICREKGMCVVAGVAEKAWEELYNSAALFGPTGFMGIYRKTHLFMKEKEIFDRGNMGFQVWNIGQAKLGVMICFDWIFPEAARILAVNGADVIAHPSNLVLNYCQKSMPVRGLENGVFCVTANRTGSESRGDETLAFTGNSIVVGPRGEVLKEASADAETVDVIEIDVEAARNKLITPGNDLLKDRRPDKYEKLTATE